MHPAFISSDPMMIKKRAATTEVKNCGCLIRKISLEGNDIIAEVETLSGFKGPDIAKVILLDKVNIGFSLRALGAVESQPDGTLLVKRPIKPITYDIVSNPSHADAKVVNFLNEEVSDFAADSVYICESEELSVLEADDINFPISGEGYSVRFINDIIEEKFQKALIKTNFSFIK